MSVERDKSRSSSDDAINQVTIDQERAQPLKRVRLAPGTIRYMYDRSSDSKATGEPGQDYLAFRYTSGRLAFAVCDGVGASFLGNLAARFLGDHLVEWLWGRSSVAQAEPFQRELFRHLRELVVPASQLVGNYPLPRGLHPIVRDVLEEKRSYGSEAMFVCGRIEWPDQQRQGQVALAWLGDAELQVCDRGGRWRRFLGVTAERWSSIRGPRGNPQVQIETADDIARIIAYSDGLRSLAEDLRRLPDSMLDQALKLLVQDPRNDDLSLIDIALDERQMLAERRASDQVQTSVSPSTHSFGRESADKIEPRQSPDPMSTVLPVPEFLSPPNNATINSGFKMTWTEVPGAEAYVIQEAPDPTFDPGEVLSEFVDQPYFTVEQEEPGIYFYRVQAQTSSAQSAWSSLLRIRIQRIDADHPR